MSIKKIAPEQRPIILRFHRLIDAFAKSDDERDFYLDTKEGFIVYSDLDRSLEELLLLEKELNEGIDRFRIIPKLTYYETKKFMEGFVNEKVYDIDTKEKLLDIIGSKESRENFLEFIYDHLTELEKWQQYYHERSRIRIIEWLRGEEIQFVFEEDLDISKPLLEKVKLHFFDKKVPKDVEGALQVILQKSTTYYHNEALNPRPKRGRPPKQAAKVEVEPKYSLDIFKTVPKDIRPFLFNPDFTPDSVTFSSKFNTKAQLMASLRGSSRGQINKKLEALSQRLESLRHLSDRIKGGRDSTFTDSEKKITAISSDGKGRLTDIAKGFLPGKAEKSEIKELIKKKKDVGYKQVTPISKRRKKNQDD